MSQSNRGLTHISKSLMQDAYKARKNEEGIMFNGCYSTEARTANLVTQEALVETSLQAKSQGFHHIIILIERTSLDQLCNKKKSPH